MPEYGEDEDEYMDDAFVVDQQMHRDPEYREVNVPMWDQAKTQPGTYQLRVSRRGVDGRPFELGEMPHDASLNQVLMRWPKAGTYLVMPIDQMGRETRRDPMVFHVDEDHAVLNELRRRSAAGGMVPGSSLGAPAGVPPEVWDMLKEQQQLAQRQLDEMRESIERERSTLAEERDKLSRERMKLAIGNTADAVELQKKIVDQGASQASNAQAQLMALMNAQRDADNAAHERRMEMMKREQDAERIRHEAWLKQMEKAAEDRREREARAREDERKWDAQRRKDERAMMEQRDKERREAAERQAANERDHMKMMMTQMKSNDPLAMVEKLIEKGAGVAELAKAVGLDKILGLGGGQSIPEIVAGTVGEVVKGIVEVKKLELETGGGEVDEIVQIQMPDGQVIQMPRSQLEALQQQQLQKQQIAMQQHQQQAQGQPQPAPEQPPVAAQPSPDQAAFSARQAAINALAPDVRKSARRALRQGVTKLKGKPESEWLIELVQIVKANPTIVEYVRAGTIFHSLIEAGADETFAVTLTTMIDSTGALPADIPRR